MPSHPYVTLAAEAVRHYLEKGAMLPCPEPLADDLKRKCGVFVSIKKHGDLRGCIGSLAPEEDNLALEIIRNAVHAAMHDPRFPAVTRPELPSLVFSVDVLTPREKVTDLSTLDCKKYGLVVKGRNRQGVLLPDLEGVETVEDQIKICRKKAGLSDDEPVEYFRFQVVRYR